MSHELTEGVPLAAVSVPASPDEPAAAYHAGQGVCRSIIVSLQGGQMGTVPWARVELTDGRIVMVNLALAELVILADRQADAVDDIDSLDDLT